MSESIYVPLAEIMAGTQLTRIQVTNDIKAGLLPGRIVRRQPRVLQAEWDAYKRGEWQPRTNNMSFVHRVKPAEDAA